MSKKIKITSDSTCDLSAELMKQYEVSTIALYVNTDEGSYRDGITMTPQDIFDYVDRTGMLPKTAAPSIADYTDFFEGFIKEGYFVVHISLSSKLSASHQNARLAAESVGDALCIDSANLSSGTGHCVIKAAEMAKGGATVQEIQSYLDEYATKVEASFVIDRLDYLHKGGRCSSIAALGANLLKLKPCIEVKDGAMAVGKKYRGNYSAVILEYVRERLSGRTDELDDSRIFITHTSCSDELVESVKQEILSILPFKEVLITRASCTITSHCGENTLGILFVRK